MSNRPTLSSILRENQNTDRDSYVEYLGRQVLSKERDIIREVADQFGPNAARLNSLKWAADTATNHAKWLYPDRPTPGDIPTAVKDWSNSDGHRDAFRHAALAALTAKEFSGHLGSRDAGIAWTGRLLHAHEGQANNNPVREAMDLYNNKVGLQIFRENPKASNEVLLQRVADAIDNGRMVVVNKQGTLNWSDRVPLYQHGNADHPVRRRAMGESDVQVAGLDAADGARASNDPLRQSAREGLDRLDASRLGLHEPGQVDRAAAALAAESRTQGLTRIDSVAASPDGQRIFAVEGAPSDPSHLRASVLTAHAAAQPLETSERLARQVPEAVDVAQVEARSRALS